MMINFNYMDALARRADSNTYQEYLQSQHWIEFRAANKTNTCFCCGRDWCLNLHHVCYDRIGEERPEDVVTVCKKCHTAIHAIIRGGVGIDRAHLVRKSRCSRASRKQNKPERWVRWQNLVNISVKQTVAERRDLLVSSGMMDPVTERGTRAAFNRKLVKTDKDGSEWWDRNKYVSRVMRPARRAANRAERDRIGVPPPDYSENGTDHVELSPEDKRRQNAKIRRYIGTRVLPKIEQTPEQAQRHEEQKRRAAEDRREHRRRMAGSIPGVTLG